uniref:PDZ domain-containing protein n=1 Tax=Heterorhabditis bacteriophora TaxID=37862 RepID=A0A1I7XLH2_HETBA
MNRIEYRKDENIYLLLIIWSKNDCIEITAVIGKSILGDEGDCLAQEVGRGSGFALFREKETNEKGGEEQTGKSIYIQRKLRD